MTNLPQRLSKQFLGAAMRVVTLALFLVVFGASPALAQTRGYVTNFVDGTVSVIATSTNTVVATVPVGNAPEFLAVDPTGTSVYVPNSGEGTVSVISTATNTIVATVAVGSVPFTVAFPTRTQGPSNKNQCKNAGWQTFTSPSFKNQGQCIKFVNHMDEHEH